MFYVYILRTSSNTLYVGQTNNLKKRLKEHQNKSGKSAKYIRYFDSVELVYSEKYSTRKEAMQREALLKKWPKSKKEAIIGGAMRTVYQETTKKGKDILVRYPEIGDMEEMLKFINELSKEKTFIRYQGEEETPESETKYLKSILEAIKNKKAVHLLVFINNKLVAKSDINKMDKTEKHIGKLGISVKKDFRGEGLGKILIELILKEAKEKIPGIKIVTLEVFSTNDIARNLYKKYGFIEYGMLPNGISRGEKFEDTVLMYKNI